MGSLGGELVKKKAMWLYPKVLGFNPSERWGHSACCFDEVVYVFGGCCGGLHFSDVLTLNLGTMAWSTLVTSGQRPGTRDSHSVVLVGHKMIVMGGTNGSKKVNDLHILDLRTKEWTRPICEGNPPSPRESHTATVIGGNKLVIFGGSGEGEANYLNDLHILDLNIMRWTSPEVNGDIPAPRDSHTAVAVDNKLIVYGGDCGDRYHGEVDVLDVDTLTWSRLALRGSSPGVRAGHAAVNIGTKVYIIGGVGDKRYYNDVWVLDLSAYSWIQLDICGQQPQGRFSHSAIVADSDIAIYGGCGEDERPLNELLILQLGGEHPNGRYNISLCKKLGSHWNQEKRRLLRGMVYSHKNVICANGELSNKSREVEGESKNNDLRNSENSKRRKTSDFKSWEVDLEQEENALSLSQHSSPSKSDQEQIPAQKLSSSSNSIGVSSSSGLFKKQNHVQTHRVQNQLDQRIHIRRSAPDFHRNHVEFQRQPKTEQFIAAVQTGKTDVQLSPRDQRPLQRQTIPPLIGAEVRGTVDGAFDSGYLMTANVNGQILRGVLFTPGPGVVTRANVPQNNPSICSPVVLARPAPNPTCISYPYSRPQPQALFMGPDPCRHVRRAQSPPANRATAPVQKSTKVSTADLQGVVLTLGGGHGGS